METEIFKIQIPIQSSMENAPALVYNEDRSTEIMIAVTDEIRKVCGENKKAYVNATIVNDNSILIVNKAPWQDW